MFKRHSAIAMAAGSWTLSGDRYARLWSTEAGHAGSLIGSLKEACLVLAIWPNGAASRCRDLFLVFRGETTCTPSASTQGLHHSDEPRG